MILLELYEDGRGKHWLRFVYNGKELDLVEAIGGSAPVPSRRGVKEAKMLMTIHQPSPLPPRDPKMASRFEKKEGRAPLCPLEEWKELANRLIPDNYEQECAAT